MLAQCLVPFVSDIYFLGTLVDPARGEGENPVVFPFPIVIRGRELAQIPEIGIQPGTVGLLPGLPVAVCGICSLSRIILKLLYCSWAWKAVAIFVKTKARRKRQPLSKIIGDIGV